MVTALCLPLLVLVGCSKPAAPGSSEQQLCNNLLEETQRLKTITQSLLLLAQADAGQLKLAREPVDLSVELEGMIEDARVLGAAAQLQFDLHLQSRVRIAADRALLHAALFNLISNAVKYNEPNGRIEIRLHAERDQIVFTIGNSGPGIPPADQPKIFARFFRGAGADPSGAAGLGLGLSLAREIIRAHGGELILAESRAGWTSFAAKFDLKASTT